MPAAAAAFYSHMCYSSQKPAAVPDHENNHPTSKRSSSTNTHSTNKPTKASRPNSNKKSIRCLEIIGVDSGRVLAQNPSLHTAPLHVIVTFLQSKGIHLNDLGRILGTKILTSDMNSDLSPVFDFLSRDLGVPHRNFRKSIKKCPRLLISIVGDQLKPALFYLRRLGFRDPHALAYRDPILLVSSVEKTLIRKLDYLVSLGFWVGDAVGPGLFTFSVENNFRPKFEYFGEEMKGGLDDELREFPQYFAFSLEKRIKPRHMEEVVRSGVRVALPLMLKSTDEGFRELLRQGNQ